MILQDFIDYSYEIKGRRTDLCLKPVDFKKREGLSMDSITGKEEKVMLSSLSRKIFQRHQKELLKEKLIIRIPTSDKRATYYSITPFGICYLIKSEYARDPDKIIVRQQKKIFPILESFAKKYTIPYRSEIFEKEKFDFTDFYKNLKKSIDDHDIGEEMPYIFSNFDYDSQLERLEFSLELFFDSPTNIILANFKDIGQSEVLLSELGQRSGMVSRYKPIKLNEDQFYQYLSRLLLSLIVYFHFQIRGLSDYSNLPEIIMRILIIFNHPIEKNIIEQANRIKKFVNETNTISQN